MRIKSFVLGGAALLSVAGLSVPALAHTRHPSTAAERKQTDDLNAQQLAQAQGQQPLQQQASASMPEQQNNAMTTTSQSNTAPNDQQNDNQQNSTKQQPGDQQNTQTPSPQP